MLVSGRRAPDQLNIEQSVVLHLVYVTAARLHSKNNFHESSTDRYNEASDNLERWRRSRIDGIDAKLATMPVSVNLLYVRNLVASYILTPGNRQQTAALITQIFEITKGKINGELSDRLWEYSNRLARRQNLQYTESSQERELAIKAVNSIIPDTEIRTTPISRFFL